jgi:hypothetical protein
MSRNLFRFATPALLLFGVLLITAAPKLKAQSAPPAPAAPAITMTETPEPPPPYNQNNPGPTSLVFTFSLTDSTDDATIVFSATGPSGNTVASATIAAPNSTSTPRGSVSVTVPISSTSGYSASAYAYIPANNSLCPPTPQSPNSGTSTQNF